MSCPNCGIPRACSSCPNEVIDTLLKRRSVRKYTDRMPDGETIETIVRAGQQTPFAGQLYMADRFRREYKLLGRVHPFVHLVMGYPAEVVEQAMDQGCLAQGFYRKQKAKIRLEGERQETFTYDDYSWTEHIAPKWGQWNGDPRELLEPLDQCGFTICRKRTAKRRPDRSEGRRSPSRLPAQRLVAGEWVFAAL